MTDCGCNFSEIDGEIYFCSLHEAAEEMLRVLQNEVIDLANLATMSNQPETLVLMQSVYEVIYRARGEQHGNSR